MRLACFKESPRFFISRIAFFDINITFFALLMDAIVNIFSNFNLYFWILCSAVIITLSNGARFCIMTTFGIVEKRGHIFPGEKRTSTLSFFKNEGRINCSHKMRKRGFLDAILNDKNVKLG